jgi:hypothetical protein
VQPPKKKQKRPAKKKHEPKKTDEETEGTVDKEVKDFFAEVKEKRKQEELEAKKNEGRKERLQAFIDEKETKRRKKPSLKTDLCEEETTRVVE